MTEDRRKELKDLMAMEERLYETTDPAEAEALAMKLQPYIGLIGEDEPEPEKQMLKASDEPETPCPVLPRDKRKRPSVTEGEAENGVNIETDHRICGVESKSVEALLLTQALMTDGKETTATPAARMQPVVALMDSIDPMNAIEAMMATQMIGLHNMAMECSRRAMIQGQSIEARDMNLRHAAKLMNAFTSAVSALDKHKGKGKQKITVEHVHVHEGGQAIVGVVHHGGAE